MFLFLWLPSTQQAVVRDANKLLSSETPILGMDFGRRLSNDEPIIGMDFGIAMVISLPELTSVCTFAEDQFVTVFLGPRGPKYRKQMSACGREDHFIEKIRLFLAGAWGMRE